VQVWGEVMACGYGRIPWVPGVQGGTQAAPAFATVLLEEMGLACPDRVAAGYFPDLETCKPGLAAHFLSLV